MTRKQNTKNNKSSSKSSNKNEFKNSTTNSGGGRRTNKDNKIVSKINIFNFSNCSL